MKQNQKRKSFLVEILIGALAIVICLSMLALTTFAWFTDETTSNGNRIVAGSLDMVVEKATLVPPALEDGDYTVTYEEFTEETRLYPADAQFEPGAAFYTLLRVRNNGSLFFKYSLSLKFTEIAGVNVAGEAYRLSDHLRYVAVQETEEITGEEVYTSLANRTDVPLGELMSETEGDMYAITDKKLSPVSYEEEDADSVDYIVLVIYMPTSVGNEANPIVPASITVNLDVIAGQIDEESDSYGDDFDNDAPYPPRPVSVSSSAEFTEALTSAGNGLVELKNDITAKEPGRTNGYGVRLYHADSVFSSNDEFEKVITGADTWTGAALELQPEAFVAGGGILTTGIDGSINGGLTGRRYNKVTGGTVNITLDNVRIQGIEPDNNVTSGLSIGWPRVKVAADSAAIDMDMPSNFTGVDSSTVNISGGIFETRSSSVADYSGAIKLVGVKNTTINLIGVTFIVHNDNGYYTPTQLQDAEFMSGKKPVFSAIINEQNRAGRSGEEAAYRCYNNTFNFIDCEFIFVNDSVMRTNQPETQMDSGTDFAPVTVTPANIANLFARFYTGGADEFVNAEGARVPGSDALAYGAYRIEGFLNGEDAEGNQYDINDLVFLTNLFDGALGDWQTITSDINYLLGSRSVYNFGTAEFIASI